MFTLFLKGVFFLIETDPFLYRINFFSASLGSKVYHYQNVQKKGNQLLIPFYDKQNDCL